MADSELKLAPPSSGLPLEISFRRLLKSCEEVVAGDDKGRSDYQDWATSPAFHAASSALRNAQDFTVTAFVALNRRETDLAGSRDAAGAISRSAEHSEHKASKAVIVWRILAAPAVEYLLLTFLGCRIDGEVLRTYDKRVDALAKRLLPACSASYCRPPSKTERAQLPTADAGSGPSSRYHAVSAY